jgi:hypothetical protein
MRLSEFLTQDYLTHAVSDFERRYIMQTGQNYELELEGEIEGEFEDELEMEGEVEGEFEDELEMEGEIEGEFEFEMEGEDEGEEFFRRLRRIASRAAPILRRVARVAAPMVGTAVGGPLGGMIARAAASQLEGEVELEVEGEFEDEIEGEFEDEAMAPMTSNQALAEFMAAVASTAQTEAEAEAMVGAATVISLSPRDRRILRGVLPHLVRGTAVLTRILRGRRSTRDAVRAVPTIVNRTARTLARRANAGQPITRRAAARAMATQTRNVLARPRASANAIQRNARATRAVARNARRTQRPAYRRRRSSAPVIG